MRITLQAADHVSSIGTFILTALLLVLTILPTVQHTAKAAEDWPMTAWTMPAILAAAILASAILHFVAHTRGRATTRPSQLGDPVGPNPPITDDLIAGAPRLLIRYTSDKYGKLTFINDGPGSMVNLKLGPLTWGDSRRLRIEGSIGVLLPGTKCEKDMSIETSPPGTWGELCDYMRGSTPADAQHRVPVTYEDSRGTKFARDFLLTSQIDGTVKWKPGPVVTLERRSDQRGFTADFGMSALDAATRNSSIKSFAVSPIATRHRSVRQTCVSELSQTLTTSRRFASSRNTYRIRRSSAWIA
jgi:hypothetical protein